MTDKKHTFGGGGRWGTFVNFGGGGLGGILAGDPDLEPSPSRNGELLPEDGCDLGASKSGSL